MKKTTLLAFLGILLISVLSLVRVSNAGDQDFIPWTDKEIETLKSLQLKSLPPLPIDPSNKFSDNPKAFILGEKIFYDTRFSANQKVACSNCHLPTYSFTDRLPLARGMATTDRRSMPFIGLAYSTYYFWDGRKDSLWAQALGPPESRVEHGISRTTCATLIYNNYHTEYEEIFGPMPEINKNTCPTQAIPDPSNKEGFAAWNAMSLKQQQAVNRIFANMGKSIATFVSRIAPAPARFDNYVDAVIKNDKAGIKVLTGDEIAGLKLFIGKSKCVNCPGGPLFTNNFFHNIGVSEQNMSSYDKGRVAGIELMQADSFNCKGKFSDADPKDCKALNFIPIEIRETAGKIKGVLRPLPFVT